MAGQGEAGRVTGQFNKYLLSTFCVPGAVQGAEMSKPGPCPEALSAPQGRETWKQVNGVKEQTEINPSQNYNKFTQFTQEGREN